MKRSVMFAGMASAAVLVLAGCTQPTPSVTIVSGSASVERPATCWSESPTVAASVTSCITDATAKLQAGSQIPTLTVIPGDVIGINVDPEIAEAGWRPSIGGQALVQTPLTSTYYRFTFPENLPAAPDGFVLSVLANDAAAGDRGIWLFRLQPRVG